MKGRLASTGEMGLATLASLAFAMALGAATASCTGDDDGNPERGLDGARDGAASEKHDPGDAASDASKSKDGASAVFSKTALIFAVAPCGAMETDSLTVANHGSSPLAISASIAGSGFSVSPAVLQVGPGKSGALAVTANVPASSQAGVPVVGSLTLFTNDPTEAHLAIPLSATPTGATLAIAPERTFAFPPGAVGTPAPPLTLTLSNTGNAAATFTFGAPTASPFSLSLGATDAGPSAVTLNAGQSWTATAGFTPPNSTRFAATSTITATGALCGTSQTSVAFSGQGATGDVMGWPATIDFGPSECGGTAPADQTFMLTNSGPVDAQLTLVSLAGPSGFTTSAVVGRSIVAGSTLTIKVTAPPVPANAPVTPVAATLTIETDAETSPHAITLTEEPSGAILAFDTSFAPSFGSFGAVELLESASQSFNVVNSGTESATVTLVASSGNASGASSPFSVSPSAFTIGPNNVQGDSATFTPLSASGVTGSIAMVPLTGSICGALPAPLSLAGSGLGGGPTITPSSLSFSANCGGFAPGPQSFIVRNDGTSEMTWSMSGPAGPGASQYTVSTNPPPGLLMPGAFAAINVIAQAIPSPAPNPTPSAFAAELTITTDVPLDPSHVVALGETPLGDQLSFTTTGPLRFGQIPIGTTLPQEFSVANNANAGSAAASVSFAIAGTGAGAYSTPAPITSLGPGASGPSSITFAPTSGVAYPATLNVLTTDGLCAPLPTPLPLSGTGTRGAVVVSTTVLTFGTDTTDPNGWVNCGAAGPSHSLSVSNVGNQAVQITGLTLGQGAASPYTLSGSGTVLPVTIPIDGSASITVKPAPVPQNVSNPNDPTPFSDTLTITTSAELDAPHTVALVMQARGAVIANTPLGTSWAFGTIPFGSIGTFASSIRNTGNAGVSIALKGLAQPGIFGLQSNPTLDGANAVASVVGQFTPPSSDGSWSDSGILSITAQQAFCEPVPTAWNLPAISVSGASSSTQPVTVSGNLAFPSTDCGSPAPGGQSVTLSNATNVPYTYKASFNSGKYYTLSSPSGTLGGNATTTIIVAPTTILPGLGVVPGSAPYADDLVISVATSPPMQWTLPISWALNGAVLSLPSGAGTRLDAAGNPYYPADSTSGYLLPMANGGTASAGVDFAIAPLGSFAFSPAAPIQVTPGIGATPELVSSSPDPACPAVTIGAAVFVYSGPVCQPFPLSKVTIEACLGTF